MRLNTKARVIVTLEIDSGLYVENNNTISEVQAKAKEQAKHLIEGALRSTDVKQIGEMSVLMISAQEEKA